MPLTRRQVMRAAVAGSLAPFVLPMFQAFPAQAYTVPSKLAWWYAARFGMFIHFGSYSYLGQGEWAFSDQSWTKASYQAQVSAPFNPTSFSASQIVGLAKDAGMKYLVITAKHHEGFAMWDSNVASFTDTTGAKQYNLHDYTAYQSDLLMALKNECAAQGIAFGLYYSIMDWMHSSQNKNGNTYTTMTSMTARSNYIADMKAQLQELITRYDPAILWFDGDWCSNLATPTLDDWWNQSDGQSLYNFLIGFKSSLVVNERVKRDTGLGDFQCPEQSVPSAPLSRPWETCATMNGSWGYTSRAENSYRPTQTILREMVTVVSRDGNYLLNIGPMGSGAATQGSITVLNGLGTWMKVHSDSIYGTTASPYSTEPSWGLYTKKSGKLYAHVFTWPSNGQLVIPSLTNTINRVYLLNNSGTSLSYTANGAGITVSLPATAPNADDSVVVVEVSGVPTAGAPAAGASVFGDVGYSGPSAALKVGSYTTAQLQTAGIGGRSISSIMIASGYRVTAYQNDGFSGTAWTFTSNNPDLRVTGNNDAISSLKVTFNPATYFQIRNVANSLVVDSGGSVASGSGLKQWTAVNSPNVQWQAIDLGNGYYRLVNRTNGMAADGWGNTTAGSTVLQAAWNGGNNQQWSITDLGGGAYQIANRTTGLVFDGGGQVSTGSALKQWSAGSSTNLQYRFESVG
jgi:alpha-L-fucosidase